jgi:alpha-galactosidase
MLCVIGSILRFVKKDEYVILQYRERKGIVMNKSIALATALLSVFAAQAERTVWVDELPIEGIDIGVAHFSTTRRASMASKFGPVIPLKVVDDVFKRGLGVHAPSQSTYEFEGEAISFEAFVGVDAWVLEKAKSGVKVDSSMRFRVVADGKTVAESPVMKVDSPACNLKANLRGAKVVTLEIDDCGSCSWDLAVWGDAKFVLADGTTITPWIGNDAQLGILTPKASPSPRINGAKVFGVRPGHEILWRLCVTGERPMKFSAENLPAGAKFDPATGLLSGNVAERGEYLISFTAENALGTAKSTLKLVVGDKIALTPPMGWNSWNVFGSFVTAKDIRAAADTLISTGLADHGWSYINIDDFWQNSVVETDEPTLKGPLRSADGTIVSNVKFPSMKELADYIHSKGLKAGIYSSPAAQTCGGCEGTYGHEWKDAETYAKWGYDYLKYDGCSYLKVSVGKNAERDFLPFVIMGEALRAQNRDIVYSINPFGAGSELTLPYGGAAAAGAHSWRTTGDINDCWIRVKSILAAQRYRWPYARPGAWNDPDMLIVGVIGGPWKFRRATRLTPNMQYTHVSLWSMLCSPLLIGCDLTKLDDFTLSLLTNDEVIETSQDELGAQAALVAMGPRAEIWAKPMSDGSFVLALINTVRKTTTIKASFPSLGLEGKWRVRDLWRQKDLGIYSNEYSCDVPPLATQLVRIWPEQGAGLRKGLTDIRMNGFYQLLEQKRPVGRPGYEPPKGWPCKDCPRGK